MKLFITYDFEKVFKSVLKDLFDKFEVDYILDSTNEITIINKVSKETFRSISEALENYGITVTEDQNLAITDRIKMVIDELLHSDEFRNYNTSDYIADKLNYSYSYLSSIFSEATFTSIESYIILKKVDKVKDLLVNTDLSLTEIAYQLDYSSVAHLSRQFKKTTGLTPSFFQKIIKKRASQIVH